MKKSVLAAVAALCVATPALAANVDATKPETILDLAKGFGSASLEKDSQGDPKIVGRIDGTKYAILFNGCTNGKDCDDIQFAAAWGGTKVTMQDINKWNQDHRYGRALLDSSNDPVIDMTVNLDYGVTRANLDESFKIWEIVLKGFKKEVLNK